MDRTIPSQLHVGLDCSAKRSRGRHVVVVAFVWAAAIVFGSFLLTRHSMVPGAAAAAVDWPAKASLPLDKSRFTLVVTLHPKCPCSRATMAELETLMVHAKGRVAAHVVFVETAGEDSTGCELWKAAEAINGVTIDRDAADTIARAFNAQTSGQTFLYDPAGRLLFSGGITASRGHVGDNDGVNAIESILSSTTPAPVASTPVYGCSLR